MNADAVQFVGGTNWAVQDKVVVENRVAAPSNASSTNFFINVVDWSNQERDISTGPRMVLVLPASDREGIERNGSIEASWPEKLKATQSALGLNVSQMASALKVSRQQIYNWLSNEVGDPDNSNLEKIDYLYNLSLSVADYRNTKYMGKLAKRRVFPGEKNLIEAFHSRITTEQFKAGVSVLESDLSRFGARNSKSTRSTADSHTINNLTGYV